VDIDNILLMAETRNTDEMKNSVTDELLSQFKVTTHSFLLLDVFMSKDDDDDDDAEVPAH